MLQGRTGLGFDGHIYSFGYDEDGLRNGTAREAPGTRAYLDRLRHVKKPWPTFLGGWIGHFDPETSAQSARRMLVEMTDMLKPKEGAEAQEHYALGMGLQLTGPGVPRAHVFDLAVAPSVAGTCRERCDHYHANPPEYSARRGKFCTTLALQILIESGLSEFEQAPRRRPDDLLKWLQDRVSQQDPLVASEQVVVLGLRNTDEGYVLDWELSGGQPAVNGGHS